MGKCMFLRKGSVHVAPSGGILASSLSVGSTVKLMEAGAAVEYLVVNQGQPSGSTMYNNSGCDGTWLLRKDVYEKRQWHSSDVNDYANSTIHSYLNSTFFKLFGAAEQAAIKQVHVPYVQGKYAINEEGQLMYYDEGLSCKVFLLSMREVDGSSAYAATEGNPLDYFKDGDSSKLWAYLNGTSIGWWLRSPEASTNRGGYVWCCRNANGSAFDRQYASYSSYGIRPALILPNTAVFYKDTMLLKGVI